jgi:hypothetical protein
MDDIPDLNNLLIHARFDGKQRVIFVTYTGTLGGEATRQYYRWLVQELSPLIKLVRGAVFDFRQVHTIEASNTRTITQSSHSAHRTLDMRHVGVALIAKDHYQEHMLRITAKMTPHPQTKRVVRSMEEALAYIDEWTERLREKDIGENI